MRLARFSLKGFNMYEYTLHLESGETFYYDDLKEARFDKYQFGGTIFDRNGKEVY